MKQFGLILAVVILLTACGPAPTPAPTPDLQATIISLSGTMVAATLTAQPSPRPTQTLQPSRTSAPTETATPELAASPTIATEVTPQATGTAWRGTFVVGNTDGLPEGLLRIENFTGEKEITVTLNGVTLTRERPVYYSYAVTGALNITILWARYQYIIQIPNKKIFTGTFTQNNGDKTTIRVYLKKDPVILGP